MRITGEDDHSRWWFTYGSALPFDAGDDQQVGEQEQRPFLPVHRLPGNDGHQVVPEECSVNGRQMYQPVDQRLDLFQLQVVLFGTVDFHRHFVHLFLRFGQRLVVRMCRFRVFQQRLNNVIFVFENRHDDGWYGLLIVTVKDFVRNPRKT